MRIQTLNATAELLIGLAFGLLIAFWWGNIFDAIIGAAFCILGVVADAVAVRFYLSDYFGPALMRAQLQGKQIPTSFDEP